MDKKYDVYGITSLILGILSVLIYFISILIPLSAIAFGLISLGIKKNTIAKVGLILGCLYTFQYINVNYLIPYLENKVDKKSEVIDSKILKKKALEYGFSCDDSMCYKSELTNTNILEEYEIDLNRKSINQTFEMQSSEDNFYAMVKAKYGFEDKIVVCTMYSKSESDGGELFDYRYNINTGERTCNVKDCSFNSSISRDLINKFDDIMSEKK